MERDSKIAVFLSSPGIPSDVSSERAQHLLEGCGWDVAIAVQRYRAERKGTERPLANVGPIEKLSALADEFRHNAEFKKKVAHLSTDGYYGWRRIRGDGNCFYRAVGFGLLEWFASPCSRSQRSVVAATLHKKISEVQFSSEKERRDHLCLLQHLMQVTDSSMDGEAVIGSLQSAFVDPNGWMDAATVSSLRHITARFMRHNVSNTEIGNGLTLGEIISTEGYKDIESFCLQKVLPEGIEAEGIIQNVLPIVLGIKLHIIFLDNKPMNGSSVPAVCYGSDQGPQIFVQLRPGHYDLIYRDAIDSSVAPGRVPDHQNHCARVELKATTGYHIQTPQRTSVTQVSTPTPEKTFKVASGENSPAATTSQCSIPEASRRHSVGTSRGHSPQSGELSPISPGSHHPMPRAHSYPAGTEVQYFSTQVRNWVPAVVVDFDTNTCTYVLQFGTRIEDSIHPSKVRIPELPPPHRGTLLESCAGNKVANRVTDSGLKLPPTARPSPTPGSTFPAGSTVEYYSERAGCWVPAVVQGFTETTQTYVLDVQPIALKSKVRASATTSANDGSTHKQIYPTGAQVEYFSKSASSWLPAVIHGFNKETGAYVLDIQPVAYPSKIRGWRSMPEAIAVGEVQVALDGQRNAYAQCKDLRRGFCPNPVTTTACNQSF